MDDEILKTVQSMLGSNIKIVDREETSSVREEETLLINGIPVQLEGDDGDAIKTALMTGKVPSCDLLNQILYRAGILRQPVHLETSLSVKSTTVKKEEVTVAKNGIILDERINETKEDNYYTSHCNELWEPIKNTKSLNCNKKNLTNNIPTTMINNENLNFQKSNTDIIYPSVVTSTNVNLKNSNVINTAATINGAANKDPSPSASSSTSTFPIVQSLSSLPSSSSSASSIAAASTISSMCSNNSNIREASSYFSLDTDKNSSMYNNYHHTSNCKNNSQNRNNSIINNNNNNNNHNHKNNNSSNNNSNGKGNHHLINNLSNNNNNNTENSLNDKILLQKTNSSTITKYNNNKKDNNKSSYDPNLSCDSGHDDIFFNSLSQTNVLQYNNSTDNSISSSYDMISSSDEIDFMKKSNDHLLVSNATSKRNTPTIFGTVASDQYPKDNANKRALPQTTNISNSSSSSAAAIRKTNDKQISQLSSSSSSHGSSSSETATAFIQNSSAGNEGKDTNTVVATEENSLVYRDGNLISGPLDALIQHMVPTSDYYPDRSYIFAFLLSARLFIRPYKLLEKICQLCEEQQNFSCKLQDTITTTKGTTETKNNDKNNYLDFENFCNNSCSGLDIGKIDCDNQNQHHMTNNGDDEECCKKLKKFAQNFVQLLAEWIDTFPYDFRDDRLMQHLRLMSKKCVCIDSNLRKDVSTMLQNLLHRLTVLDKYEEFLQSISNDSNDCPTNSILIPSSSNSAGSTTENRTLCGSSSSSGSTNVGTSGTTSTSATSNQNSSMQQQQQSGNTYHGQTIGNQIMNASGMLHHTNSSSSSSSTSNCLHSSSSHSTNSILSSIDIIELCPNPTLLAHQLTHIELERLSHIGPEEFVQAFAKENPHLEQSFNDIKKTRNLESYIQWFNRLSYFVATEIVKHCKKKQRVRIVEYWIETARECFNIGNFNSLMAIIAGLNMSPISRLKKTWAKVQSAKFSVLEHQMDPSSNFNSYRSTLKAAMWRSAGATDERERIVIPFFSLLVKDLYFLNEGCSNKLANGHVNFEKFWQLAKQVTEFIAWKQVTCPFEKIPKVIMFLYTNHILNENMLALASFECEPPENHEKDRYKCLKSEQQQQQHQQQQQQQQQQLNQQQQQQHYHYHQQQ